MANFQIYHTTEHRGNHQEIEARGGVYGDTTDLFLGRGFYYWEDNYQQALVWGQRRYKGNFYVFSGTITFDLDKMFDISTMTHNNFILKLFKQFKAQYKHKTRSDTFFLGLFIDFLLNLQNDLLRINKINEDEVFFPFDYSKGIDHSAMKRTDSELFSKRDPSWYFSSPLVFFCVYQEKMLTLNTFKLVKTAGVQQ